MRLPHSGTPHARSATARTGRPADAPVLAPQCGECAGARGHGQGETCGDTAPLEADVDAVIELASENEGPTSIGAASLFPSIDSVQFNP